METSFFPIDVDYAVVDGKPIVRIFGLSDSGERRILYDDSFAPYCYVEADRLTVESTASGQDFVTGVVETERNRLGRKMRVCQVFTRLPEEVPKVRQLNLRTYDADIPFYKRYLLDKGFGSSDSVHADVDGDRIKRITHRSPGSPPLKSIAVDIETFSRRAFPDFKVDPVVAISVSNNGVSRCFTWLQAEGDGVERVVDERALLGRFAEFISENGFNTIVGYNSDTFDLPYIKERAAILGVKLAFNGFEIKMRGGKRPVSEINGMAHIDILNFIRNIYAVYNLKTEVLSLREVAAEMLGEKKGDFDWDKVDAIFSDRKAATDLCTYCMQDSYLTFKLYGRLYNIIIELNKLVGQTLSDVSRMTTGSVVEHLIMKKAVEIDELIPNRPSDFEVNERIKRINEGAFVFQPKPGLYEDVAVVDFRSLYPSIIISHNICPSTIRFENGAPLFAKKDETVGFVPATVDEIIRLRVDAKARLKVDKDNPQLKARVMVLKLIANGFYGYLGYYNARWYCFECAGAITALGREYVHGVINRAESDGYKIIYADTDSAFVHRPGIKDAINDLVEGINKTLPYPMELELQGIYKRAIFVSGKGGGRGAKKKYALCDGDGNLVIKGFQSVRRDWAIIAKETQVAVLKKILVDKDTDGALSYVKDVIDKIKFGDVPLEKLVITTRLHKELSSYHQTGRHVAAAQKSGADFGSGDTVRYIISRGRPGESISSRAVLFEIARKNSIRYDPEYYIKQQIVPSVSQIFDVLGYAEEDVYKGKNASLQGFF